MLKYLSLALSLTVLAVSANAPTAASGHSTSVDAASVTATPAEETKTAPEGEAAKSDAATTTTGDQKEEKKGHESHTK